MPQLIALGTSNAIPSPGYENTHLAIKRSAGILLVDCPGSPIIRLQQAGLDPLQIDRLLLTHFHPDHVSGTPAFLMQSWLMGRKEPLHIYGLAGTLARTRSMMDLFEWQKWPGFFPVLFHDLPEQELHLAFADDEMRLFTSLVRHIIPATGIRCEFIASRQVLAYSCDTAACQEVVRLAAHADLLLHEASGENYGHTSAVQAGEIATQAKARQLVLIHYPTTNNDCPGDLIDQARKTFAGPVSLACDFMRWDF